MRRVENTKEQQQSEKQRLSAAHTLSNAEIMKRTAPLSALNIVELYKEGQNRDLIGYGYQQGDVTLTLKSTKESAEEILAGNGSNTSKLITKKGAVGMPIIYSSSNETNLTTTELPQIGLTDVQVVTLDPKPTVFLGLYESGIITFPGNIPSINGIVFSKAEGSYFAVGYYNATNQNFVALSEIENLAANLRYVQEVDTGIARTEDFYVLENEYFQLVVSSIGGSLSEINLPLRGKENPDSIVRPIQFDKTIDSKYPKNSYFPEKPYFVASGSGSEKKQPVQGGYYPLLRRGIYGKKPSENIDAPVRYNGLNLVSDDPRLSTIRYTVSQFTNEELVLQGKYQGRTIVKRFALPKDGSVSPYIFDYSLTIQGNPTGMWLTTGVPEVELISGSFMPALKYAQLKNGKLSVDQIKQPKPTTNVEDTTTEWVSNGNGFFGIILDSLSFAPATIQAGQVAGEADPSRITVIDSRYNLYPPKDYPGYELLIPLENIGGKAEFRVFAGPFDASVLKTIDKTYTDPTTGVGPRYIETQSFHGWFSFISEPFAKFLLILMNFFHFITGSWGISIILLTVALRVMLYPLNNWSIKSMAKMQEVGPKIERIREKYKKDQRRMQQEVMKVYKEEGGNPFSGCLPLLIQMPFLIGMFDLLKSSFELRGATFIPGWITNLAAPDVLFSWGYPIPFIGSSFHLLPILLGGVMYIQQRASQKRSKRKHATMTDQQKQQQQMGKIMTLVFTVLFYKSPSGLNLYWISSMGLSAIQQWYTVKRMEKK